MQSFYVCDIAMSLQLPECCRVDCVLVGGVRVPGAGRADEGAEEDTVGPLERAQRGAGEAQVRGQEGGQRRAALDHRQKVSSHLDGRLDACINLVGEEGGGSCALKISTKLFHAISVLQWNTW